MGQTKGLWVRVADEHRYLMRLLIIRVPEEVAKLRRADLEAEALRRNRPIRQRAWALADWTILLTDAPADLPNLQEALVLLEQRSLVKLAQVIRASACSLIEALAGSRSLCSVLQSRKRSDAFGVPHEQTQETPQFCTTPATGLDELGLKPLSWCVWGKTCRHPYAPT